MLPLTWLLLKKRIFGAVANVMRAKDLDEVIQWINSSNYGNAASIFTSMEGRERVFNIRWSAVTLGSISGSWRPWPSFPFSGMKDSFYESCMDRVKMPSDFLPRARWLFRGGFKNEEVNCPWSLILLFRSHESRKRVGEWICQSSTTAIWETP